MNCTRFGRYAIIEAKRRTAVVKIKKQIITGRDGRPVAVVVDVETFKEIEELLEDVADLKIVEARADEADLDWESVKTEL
jgi:prevent-host-death family protein